MPEPARRVRNIDPVEEEDDGTPALRAFIDQVVKHACDRATQRERESYFQYDIHKTPPAVHTIREIPEYNLGSHERHLPADDTLVIKGFVRSAAFQVCREKGVFYFHAVDEHGETINFDPRILKADYLFPYMDSGKWARWYAKIDRSELIALADLEKIIGKNTLVHKRAYYYLVRFMKGTVAE